MADVKISEMTPDSSIGGDETWPVADSGLSKRITATGLKNFVVDQIEAITAGTVVDGNDKVYILDNTDGALKPVDIDTVLQHIIDAVWNKTAETSPDDADEMLLKDTEGTEKTIMLVDLASYVLTAISASDVDITDLDDAGTLADANYLWISQDGTGKKVMLSVLMAAILAGFNSYFNALGLASSAADTDVFYIRQIGGAEKKVTLAAIKTALNITLAPGSTTENKIPQWDSTAKTLKDGLTLRTTVRAEGSTDNISIPTEEAVREAVNIFSSLDDAGVLADANYFWVSQSGIGNKVALTVLKNSILAGFNSYLNSLDVASSAADTDVFYIRQIGGTEKKVTLAAIKTALNITLAPGSTTENKIPQWDSTAKTLKDGLTLRTTVRAEGSTDNISIPTEEAVREAVEAFVSGQDDIAEDLSDTDEMLVYNDSGAVHAKSGASRFWTYIVAKLAGVTDVSAYGFVLDEANLASNSATKVPTQQSVKSYVDEHGSGWDGDIADVDLDGGADIDADLADVDLILVDDGAGGTNRKSAISRIWTYIATKLSAVTDVSGYGFVIDEDDMSSDDATKVPTQQSVKAYVDAAGGGGGEWDGSITDIDLDGGDDIGAALADADLILVDDGASGTNRKSAVSRLWTYVLTKIEAATGIALISPVVSTKLTFNESTNDLDVTASDQSGSGGSVDFPDINGIDATALVIPTAVDGILSTGNNTDFVPTKLVYFKTCEGSDGDDIIDLHDGTYLGQILTIGLLMKIGSDNAVITPLTTIGYSTITLDADGEVATLMWQGGMFGAGWVILHTNGTVA